MAADAIRIELLPARMGDCILVECLRRRGDVWRLLVDGGPPDTWPLLQERLTRLAADGQQGRLFIGFAAAELLGLIAFAVAMIILYAR